MKSMKKKGKGRRTLAYQIFTLFLAGIILVDVLSYFGIKTFVSRTILRQKETMSEGIALDVDNSVKEYASYDLVLDYLLEHRDDGLDLEYDKSDETKAKTAAFLERNPELDLKTVTKEEFEALTEDDKKIYSEIVFNNLLLRFNSIKASYDISFLYIFAADDSYDKGTFIISASDGTQIRGTEVGNAYIFGTVAENNPEQAEFFKNLDHEGIPQCQVYNKEFLDTYRFMFRVGDKNIVTGMTFDISEIEASVTTITRQYLILFTILMVLLVIFCRLLLQTYAVHPLKKLENNVNEYAANKDGEKVKKQLETIKVQNEIGSLSDGIFEMICEIETHLKEIKEVTAENERISVELDLAQKIQTDMLPSTFPDNKHFAIYATTDPAKEVGGDFYDFFMPDEDHIVLVMADVSGKGVPASLFMVIAKALIKNRMLLGGSLSEVLRDVNSQLSEGNAEGMFVTVWLAVVDLRTGKGIAANAGHEHPVLRHKDGSYELIKYRHSMALAMIPDVPFEEHEFELAPGDRIFVYTDGLPEARRGDGEFYGTTRMLEALNQEPDVNPQRTIENVTNNMSSFVAGAEQFDDVTIMVFDYIG